MLLNKLLQHMNRNDIRSSICIAKDMNHSPSHMEFIRARNTLLRNPYRLDAYQYTHCIKVVKQLVVKLSIVKPPAVLMQLQHPLCLSTP